jgi:hypothetical protein
MLNFKATTTGIELEYEEERWGNSKWLWDELTTHNKVRLSRVFRFERTDLLNPPTPPQDPAYHKYRFQLGSFNGSYLEIPAKVLNIKNDLHIDRAVKVSRATFVAERNVSVFGRLSALLEHSDPIVIGGSHPNAIPQDVFEELIKKFPSKGELDRYANARVYTILSEYLDGMKDARGRYDSYLNKKSKALPSTAKLDLSALEKLEVEKYTLIRNLISDALATKKDLSENEWQKLMLQFLLLLFPKYIMVLENIPIDDYYSNPAKKTERYIDIGLLDANGNLDVIEVKKPFDDKILRKSQYRDNSIPTTELSGSIMQAEKYLFHLSKWGVQGEKALNTRYAAKLPAGMEIRISNPKAIIIVGRDQIGGTKMTRSQLLDFEVIKRKYANMMDIITYDDLLRRLNHTITALGG